MNFEDIVSYCQEKKAVTEGFPFDDRVLVLKVAGKMFALIDSIETEYVNLKCDPEKAIELRERYHGVQPGYHMSKRLWNSVYLNDDVNDQLLRELIDHSYDEVVKGLTKKIRLEYALG